MTYLGSAIWSYSLFRTGAILLTMVPAIIITSACLGVARATSNPKRAQSYLADAVDIISIAQQDVPNTSGQSEFDLAQLITSSNFVTRMPPPAVGCTSPGKDRSSGFLGLTSISALPFYVHTGIP